jgi:hypothetical protein
MLGEIWVAGASVGAGYFGRPDDSAACFHGRIAGDPERYLRTGDLGFFMGRELFHGGRLKDLLIIHGANRYPQDIEYTVERADPMVRPGGVAAFELERDGVRGVGVVAEVVESPLPARDAERVLSSVRRQLASGDGLHVAAVALIRPGTSLKTTSGKIQRSATRDALLSGSLALEAIWRDTDDLPASPRPAPAGPGPWWSYQIAWQRSPLPPGAARRGAWIVVPDRGAVSCALDHALRDRGAHVVVLSREAIAAGSSHAPDPARLCRAISDAVPPAAELRGVIVLSALDVPADDDGGAAICSATHAVAELVATRGLGKIVVVTRGAVPCGAAPVVMAQAALWATARALCFDQPQHPCALIDLDPSPDAGEASDIAASIAADADEPELALRGGQRHVPRWRVDPPRGAPGPGDFDRWPLSGVHVVGAFDAALGLHLADWLITRGVRHVVLLTDAPEQPAIVEFVRTRGELGVTIDVADPDAAAQAAWLPGVRGAVLTLAASAAAAGGLASGLRKLAALDAAFGDHRGLELFATCSSAVGALGAPAAADAAALAAAIAAIAQRRLASGLVAAALVLGPVAQDEVHAAQLASAGIRFARHADVLDALIAMARGAPGPGGAGRARLVLPFDLATLLELSPVASDRPVFGTLTAPAAHAVRDRGGSAHSAYVAPRNGLERVLAELVATTLRVDRVGVDDSFFALGGDSILATDLLASVNTRFGVALGPRQVERLFERFTVAAMARVVHQALVARISGMTTGEIKQALDKPPEG